MCEVAKHELFVLKEQFNFTLAEIDITQSVELFIKYKEDIPVIMLNGEFISRYKVDKALLINKLKINV